MSSAMLRQVEKDIQQQKRVIDLGDALERLKSNRDFKKVITEGYFEQEAIRLVHLKSNPSTQSDESQKSIDQQIISIGSLGQYFTTVDQLANMARKNLDMYEQTREDLIQEGVN